MWRGGPYSERSPHAKGLRGVVRGCMMACMSIRPLWRTALTALLLALMALTGKAWRDTMMEPVVHHTRVALLDYPVGAPPVRLVLISDLHVAGPDMPPSRLARIVAQINSLAPDLVLVAGDFVSDKRTATHIYSTAQALAPLRRLEARLGVVAVPGNHDHWRNMAEVRAGLEHEGVTVLQNKAVQLGPLVIGGVDDDFTNHADVASTLASMEQWRGAAARVVLSHSPDVFPALPPDVGLTLAGHTHCGQIGWPWGGSPAQMSRYGQRYACGRVDEGGRTIVTGGGLGTSILPFRLFTQPEVWVVEVGG